MDNLTKQIGNLTKQNQSIYTSLINRNIQNIDNLVILDPLLSLDEQLKTLIDEYRGGTPGYKLNDNEYYGFGHRTYYENNIIKHDIFKWIVHFDKDKLPRISHFDIEQPYNSKYICDPTSIIEINNKKYLITAETDKGWFEEQDYVTNVYEIIE